MSATRVSGAARTLSSRLLACLSALAVSILLLGLSAASAQTLDEIIAKKKIVVGIIVDYPPFGFLNEQQEPAGYDVDFAKLMGEALGVEVEFVQVSGANRIPFLVTKKIDMLVADLGITPERAKQVMFTSPYSGSSSVVVSAADRNLAGLEDLRGLRVGVARASSNDIFFTQAAPDGVDIMRFDGEGTAAQALLSGQVDVLVASNTMVDALFKENPDQSLATKFTIKSQADSLAVRKDAFELAQWLNTFIYYVKADGTLDALYRKWVGTPLPDLPPL